MKNKSRKNKRYSETIIFNAKRDNNGEGILALDFIRILKQLDINTPAILLR